VERTNKFAARGAFGVRERIAARYLEMGRGSYLGDESRGRVDGNLSWYSGWATWWAATIVDSPMGTTASSKKRLMSCRRNCYSRCAPGIAVTWSGSLNIYAGNAPHPEPVHGFLSLSRVGGNNRAGVPFSTRQAHIGFGSGNLGFGTPKLLHLLMVRIPRLGLLALMFIGGAFLEVASCGDVHIIGWVKRQRLEPV